MTNPTRMNWEGDGMAYTATSPCGCVSAVLATGIDTQAEEAKCVADWIKGGRTVQRTTVEQARAAWKTTCPHTPQWGREKAASS